MELVHREDWGEFLTSLGLIGEAVEIGTHKADLAVAILSKWHGTLHCVDPWAQLPEYAWAQLPEYADKTITLRNRDIDYQTAMTRLAPFMDHCRIHRAKSEDVVGQFTDASLDFVYIDGNHKSPWVDQDLELWWPKVKPGGILAGHDYINAAWPDVLKAVDAFVSKRHLSLSYRPEPWGEWWIVK